MKSLALKTSSILVFTLLAACGKNAPTYSLLPEQNSFKGTATIVNNKVDILWVVDNSASMTPLQTNMLNNFQSFISNFENKGYDFRIAVTGTNAYLAASYQLNQSSYARLSDGTDQTSHTGIHVLAPNTPNLQNVFLVNANLGETSSGDERAFSSFKEALTNSVNTPYQFPRPGAYLAIIILSDEDDFSTTNPANFRCQYCGTDHNYSDPRLDTVQSYVDFLDQLTGSPANNRFYSVSAITVQDTTCLNSHKVAAPSTVIGQRHIQLANATGGAVGSVCDTSYASNLDMIQARIAELSTKFTLTRTPVVSTLQVIINGQVVPNDSVNGWTYDSNSNSIYFHGTATPAQGDNIQINYDPTTVKTS